MFLRSVLHAYIAIFIALLAPNLSLAQNSCTGLFTSKKENLWVRITLKDAPLAPAKPSKLFFTYDPIQPPSSYLISRVWNNTKELFKYAPRQIAKYSIKDSDYRFSPFRPLLLPFSYIPQLIDRYTGQLLVEKLSHYYLGTKKHLRLWFKIPIYTALISLPLYNVLDAKLNSLQQQVEQEYIQRLTEYKDLHLSRIQNDFRFIDIKEAIEIKTSNGQTIPEANILIAANQRAQQIVDYQTTRDQMPSNTPLQRQINTYLKSPLFAHVSSYINSVKEKPSDEIKYKLVQLTHHYLTSLEILDLYLNHRAFYDLTKRVATEDNDKTILSIIDEIENHNYFKETISKYYQWGVLPLEQYTHYTQAYFYYQYRLAFNEAIMNPILKDSNKPLSEDNIFTLDDALQLLVIELFKKNPQILEKIKSENNSISE